MERLRERAEEDAPVAQLLDELLHETGYRRRCRPSGRSRPRAGSRTSRSSCGWRASTTSTRPRAARSGSSCSRSSLLADADTIRDDEGLVTLMTMHNAKGLEFPIVFMIGMEDGIFPHSRSIEESNVEEERRLAYVGLTRAMRDLTLTFARRRDSLRRRGRLPTMQVALPGRDPARADRPAGPHLARASRRRGGSRRGRARRPPSPRSRTPATRVFHVGDDVVHAKLGEGVVTGVRAGRDRRRALRGRARGPQADGRLRADPQALKRVGIEPARWG